MRNSANQVFKGNWDKLATAFHTSNFSTVLALAKSHFITPKGDMIFTTQGNTVQMRQLSRNGDINTIGPVLKTFVITEDADPRGIDFDSTGDNMIIAGRVTKKLYQYPIPAGNFDIDSIVASPGEISLFGLGVTISQCRYSRDGDFVFVSDDNDLHSFPLPTNYDITSNISSTLFNPGENVDAFAVKPEGDKLYLANELTGLIKEFKLSTPNVITTATPTGKELNPFLVIGSMSFQTGNDLVILSEIIFELTKLFSENSWDLENFSHFPNTEPTTTTGPRAITWVPNGMSYIIADFDDDTIKQYSVPNKNNQKGAVLMGTPFDISAIQNRVNGMWWERNGMYCYIIGLQSDRLVKLNVTSPYDVSTMSAEPPVTPFDLQFPTGIYFNDDESRAWISDTGLEGVNEYVLTTPGDTSTMNLPSSLVDFLPTPDAPDPQDIILDPTETIAYVISMGLNRISRYTKTKNETISNAIFVDSLDVSNEETQSRGFFIQRDNGKKVHVVGEDSLSVISYDIIPLVP